MSLESSHDGCSTLIGMSAPNTDGITDGPSIQSDSTEASSGPTSETILGSSIMDMVGEWGATTGVSRVPIRGGLGQ